MGRALLAIICLSGCSDSYSVRIRFASAELQEKAEQVELMVVDRCPDDLLDIPADSFRRVLLREGEPADSLGEFPDGSYALYARALSGECRTIAAGCSSVLLVSGGSDELQVTLSAVERETCAPELCSCSMNDASLDTMVSSDAGADVFDSSTPDASANCALGDYPRTILADNPEFYFRFEPPTPSEDAQGTTNANLLRGFTTEESASPALGQSVFLREPEASFELEDNRPDDASFTIEVWIRVPEEELMALPRAVLISETFSDSGFRFWVTDALRLGYTTRFGGPSGTVDEDVNFDEVLVVDEWTHVALAVDASIVRGYLNGEEVVSAPAPTLIPGGNQSGSGSLNGLSPGLYLDELAYYTTALTSDQIRAHYLAGLECPAPDL